MMKLLVAVAIILACGAAALAQTTSKTWKALRTGARFERTQMAPSPEWRSMDTAPKDGTIFEIRCTYGVAPWYRLYKWGDWGGSPGWVDARDPHSGLGSLDTVGWRPYTGDSAKYVDPTGGLQDDPAYWRGAVAAKYNLPLDAFEAEARRNDAKWKKTHPSEK